MSDYKHNYRGLIIRLYAKSFSITGSLFSSGIVFLGEQPRLDNILRLIDACQTERFAGDDHRQIYYSWRHYPRAMFFTAFLFFMLGVVFSGLFFWLTL